jgi:ankyrin repeat protein
LHYAELYGNDSTVTLLLEKGADIHAQNKNGQTPLHLVQQEQPKQSTIITLLQQAEKQSKGYIVQGNSTHNYRIFITI